MLLTFDFHFFNSCTLIALPFISVKLHSLILIQMSAEDLYSLPVKMFIVLPKCIYRK